MNPWRKKQKLNELEGSLGKLWETLPLNLKSNQGIWKRFMNIQQRVKILKMKLEKEIKF